MIGRGSLLAQRIFALALGYEDFIDHEGLCSGPGVRRVGRHARYAARQLEHAQPVGAVADSYQTAHAEIVLDLDATDVPLHGKQERCSFHGHYDHDRYPRLFVYCGYQPRLARLRPANIAGAARALEAVHQLVGKIRAR